MAKLLNRETTSMNTQAQLADRLRRYSASRAWPAVGGWMARLLSPPTPQEHERRRAHLAALLLVAVVATAKDVSGLTDGSATYRLYVLAIAVSALGGFVPGVCGDAGGGPAPGRSRTLRHRLRRPNRVRARGSWRVGSRRRSQQPGAHAPTIQLAALQAVNGELRGQARRGQITLHALQHLEDIAPDAAVFLVSAQGLIVEWSESAERMYGYTDKPIVGTQHRGDMCRRRHHDRLSGAARGEVSRGAGAPIRRAPSIVTGRGCTWSSR